jgi:3-methyl-2-oxobutanoate hydroxymethyltransferase
MSTAQPRVRVTDLAAMKRAGRKIAMLTAYDATMARIMDDAGVDVLLVGDSLGMVVMGHDSTVGVTLDMVVHHCRAVSRGASRALVVGDLPFLTCHTGVADAVRNAGRLIQEGGASAVKVEGGSSAVPVIRALIDAGIPVMGHVGLMPQHVHRMGGYRAVGKRPEEAEQLAANAGSLEEAGAFAVVLECIPAELARNVTSRLSIPTIGIGAGPDCDGQVLVSYDAFGLYQNFAPRFAKRFGLLGDAMSAAAKQYIEEVRGGTFPGPEHSF